MEQSARAAIEEPGLRMAPVVKVRGVKAVTGHMRHFERIPGLPVANFRTA